MVRALDHIVWPARDLDGLAETFRHLGFTVGRRNRHPWGTVNHIVQFDGAFIELLGFAEDYVPTAPTDAAFPFAGFCERFLRRHEAGAAMLVLRSDGAVADAETLRARGLGHGRTLPFSRVAEGPDGSDRSVAFTIAFADLPATPEIGLFLCEQHRPENFWSPAAQRHANRATGIEALELRSPAPGALAHDLRRVAEASSHPPGSDVVLAGTTCMEVSPAEAGAEPAIATVTLRVADLPVFGPTLQRAGVAATAEDGGLTTLAPALGRTRLRFVQDATAHPSVRTRAAT